MTNENQDGLIMISGKITNHSDPLGTAAKRAIENGTTVDTESRKISNDATKSHASRSTDLGRQQNEFVEGVIYACARLIEMGEPTIAEDILIQSGVQVELGCEDDLKFIRSIERFRNLPVGRE